ncbi:MAG: sugar transferase [Bacteroidota bacterium]
MFPFLKRLFDFLCAAVGILIASPILVVAIVILKLTGEGKVFFIQKRVGYKNQLFKIYKFTTMLSAAPEQKNKTNIGKRDPRITPIGAFLRMSKIDELPQLFNVLKGDVSFVGPRALMKTPDFDSYPPEVQANIYNVRPGITGIGSVVFRDEAQLISQVKDDGKDAGDFKSKVIFDYKGRLEMWYNQNQSFWVDVKILLLTAWTLVFPSSQLAFRLFKDLPEQTNALKIEFDRMLQLKESITLLMLVVAILIPIIPPPLWALNNWHFILMALIPVLYFTYLLSSDNKMPVRVTTSDLGWFGFLALGAASFTWAVNDGLVWYPLFGWLGLILWMFLFRSLSPRDTSDSLMPMLFCFFFLIIMIYHVAAIAINLPTDAPDSSWNDFFGKNRNYTSCFLVSLFPFLLFYEGRYRLAKWTKGIFIALTVYVLAFNQTPWATVAFLIVILYYAWTHMQRRYFWLGFGGLLTAFSVAVFFNPTALAWMKEVPLLRQMAHEVAPFKQQLLAISLEAFTYHPLLGVGLGNWHIAAYGLEQVPTETFYEATSFIRYKSHNLYTRQLVEVGAIGFLLFALPITIALGKGLRFKKELDGYEQAALATLVVYLFTAFFYADVNFYEYHFSAIHLLAFCALGILTGKNSENYYTLPAWTNGVLLTFSIVCLGWFIYAKSNYNQYNYTKEHLSKQSTQQSIEQLEALYHPVFNTNYTYRTSIAFELAKLYQQQGENELATAYFQQALWKNPTNEAILLSYAKFLWHVRNDRAAAKRYAEAVYVRQPNHYELNLLLAELAISEQSYQQARQYLAIFQEHPTSQYDSIVQQLQSFIPIQ